MRLIDMKEFGAGARKCPRARNYSFAPLGQVHSHMDAGAVFAPRKTTSRTTCAAGDEAMV